MSPAIPFSRYALTFRHSVATNGVPVRGQFLDLGLDALPHGHPRSIKRVGAAALGRVRREACQQLHDVAVHVHHAFPSRLIERVDERRVTNAVYGDQPGKVAGGELLIAAGSDELDHARARANVNQPSGLAVDADDVPNG